MAVGSTQWTLLGLAFPEHGTSFPNDRLAGPSIEKLSWTEEANAVQAVEIIPHLIETPAVMLKIMGLGCLAQTENLALKFVIPMKKWKSSPQLNIPKSRMCLMIPDGIEKESVC